MVDEKKIDSYRAFYDTLIKFLKIPDYKIDWSILTKHQGFVENFGAETVFDHQIETVQKEFDNFVKTLTDFPIVRLAVAKSAEFNSKINVKGEFPETSRKQSTRNSSNLLVTVIDAMSEYSTQVERDRKINRQKLINTYETLITTKKCLADYGLLLEEIIKRSNYTFYNFVLVDKTKPKKETFWDYLITREQLDDYVNDHNEGKSLRIKGRFWAFSPKTDITITATKFKNVEEINLYKKLKSIRDDDDKEFSKSAMCVDKTSEFISSKVLHLPQTLVNSIDDLIKKGKIKEALEATLEEPNVSPDDKSDIILVTT